MPIDIYNRSSHFVLHEMISNCFPVVGHSHAVNFKLIFLFYKKKKKIGWRQNRKTTLGEPSEESHEVIFD